MTLNNPQRLNMQLLLILNRLDPTSFSTSTREASLTFQKTVPGILGDLQGQKGILDSTAVKRTMQISSPSNLLLTQKSGQMFPLFERSEGNKPGL